MHPGQSRIARNYPGSSLLRRQRLLFVIPGWNRDPAAFQWHKEAGSRIEPGMMKARMMSGRMP